MKKYVIVLLLVLLAACTKYKDVGQTGTTEPVVVGSTQELKEFENAAQLMEYLDTANTQGSSGNALQAATRTFAMDDMAEAAPAAMGKGVSDWDGSAEEFSSTNIQVEGVDEADFVKNDGKYIYMVSQDKLIIVEAYPAEDAKIISETDLDGEAMNLFINEDRLVVFTQEYGYVEVFGHYDYLPRPIYKSITKAVIFDVSDREKPKEVDNFDLHGNFFAARMIGDYVYLVVQDGVYYWNRIIDLPVIRSGSETLLKPSVYYFDNPETSYNFNTIMSLNVKSGDIEAKSFMMGYSNNIYVSQDNIYITYMKNLPYRYYYENNEEKFNDVVLPLLPADVQRDIKGVTGTEYEKWEKVAGILEDMYNNMDEDDKDDLITDIEDALFEYEIKQEQERRKTVIHKISIDHGDIEYKTKGEVPGSVLNQFSMDEDGQYFRIATTVNAWARGESILYNNVFVLDNDLEVIGKLEDIAPDESIYSTRFIGDRLYMVTFKRIDPFFVIDLSNPRNPEILGELKIPGFSEYLHPYDEDHIIGVGKETDTNQWGGVSTEGVKVALFDVSDVTNPVEIDHIEIGTSGSDSEALNDHKAFLFDKKKGIIVIPVREVKSKRVYDQRYGYYRWNVWQGAYVLNIDEDGISKRGKVSHTEGDENYYYYGGPNAVRRSLYMDDVLYTVSMNKVLANDLESLDEISEVELPYTDNYYPYYKGMIEPMIDVEII